MTETEQAKDLETGFGAPLGARCRKCGYSI